MADIANQVADRAAELYHAPKKEKGDFMNSVNQALTEFHIDIFQKAAVRKAVAQRLGRRGHRRKRHLKNIAAFLEQQKPIQFDEPSTC